MIRRIGRFLNAWLPPLIIMTIIFALSTRQNLSISTEHAVNFSFFKTLHVLEYGLLTLLFFRALFLTTKLLYEKMIMISIFLTILYSISDEIHQTYVPTRTGQPRDILIDAIGIFIMGLLIYKNRQAVKNLLSYTTL